MKSETEILGAIDALLAQLPDDAARERAFAWLRAKHAPNLAVKLESTPTVNPPPRIPLAPPHDFLPVLPGIIGPWPEPKPLKITWVGHGGMCACPQCVPPVYCATLTIDANRPDLSGTVTGPFSMVPNQNNACCAPNIYPDWVWVGETRGALPPYPPNGMQTVNMGGPNAYPSHMHVGGSAH